MIIFCDRNPIFLKYEFYEYTMPPTENGQWVLSVRYTSFKSWRNTVFTQNITPHSPELACVIRSIMEKHNISKINFELCYHDIILSQLRYMVCCFKIFKDINLVIT